MKTIFIHPSFLQMGGAERVIFDFFSNTANSLLLTFFKTEIAGNVVFTSKKEPFLKKLLGYKINPFSKSHITNAARILANNWKTGDNIVFSNFPASLIVYYATKIRPEIKNGSIYYFCFEPDKILYYDKITKYEYLPESLKGKRVKLASKFLKNWQKKDFFVVNKLCHKVLTLSEFALEQTNRIYEFNNCVKIGECYVDKKRVKQVDKTSARLLLNKKYDLKLEKDDFIVLSLSRAEPEKGFMKILKLAKKAKDVKFLIAGKGSLSKKLKTASNKIENLHYLRYVPESLLSIVYSSSNCFLFLGRDETCGPLVLVEAMYSGNKIVASKEGSVFEYIVDEKNGLLVDPKNIKEILGAIRKIHLFDTEKYNKSFIEKNCLLEHTLKGFNKVINKSV